MLWDSATLTMLGTGILETLYMTVFSTLLSYLLGLPMGVLLVMTDRGSITPLPWFNRALDILVNLVRSIPFLILLIAVLPFTRLVTGTTLGSTATVVPLVLAAAPFVARLVESSLKELDRGVTEAAQSMGCNWFQIVVKVWIPETRSSLVTGAAIACTTILGYSAMAGAVGGGGLGDIAIRYGYYRNESDISLITVILLVIVVQIFQEVGMHIARRINKRA